MADDKLTCKLCGEISMTEGIIYVLTNAAMPGYTKVGKTTSSIEQRIRELDTTGVPLPFECFYAARVADIDFVERQLHEAFGDHRVRPRREFFSVPPERVQSALILAALEDVTPKNDVVEDADDQAALNRARRVRSNFNFKMVDIAPGAELTFAKDPTTTAIVVDHKRIEFEGERTSLSQSALTIARRLGYQSSAVSGPAYWEYEGETLDERRRRMESED